MKLILLENIKSLGVKGDIKEVTDGYAINFLLPQKKAALATAHNLVKQKYHILPVALRAPEFLCFLLYSF